MNDKKKISVITPCYNEELNISVCYKSVKKVFDSKLSNYEYEHIFADNASTDSSAAILRDIAAKDRHIKVILNARNYGPFRSTFNALLKTSGDAVVVLLAVDLQDPPEMIEEFVREWENGFKVVYGIRANREESFLMRLIRKAYYRTVNRMADIYIPPDVSEFQLIDRKVVEALRQCDDYYPYIRGLIANCGFKSKGIPYTWKARARGFSKNKLYHLIDQALNGLISFTNIPMRICMFVGFVISFFSFLYGFYTVSYHLLHNNTIPGVPTLISALFFFAGIQFMIQGLFGEYIAAIHSQVRKRPLVVEFDSIGFEEPEHIAGICRKNME